MTPAKHPMRITLASKSDGRMYLVAIGSPAVIDGKSGFEALAVFWRRVDGKCFARHVRAAIKVTGLPNRNVVMEAACRWLNGKAAELEGRDALFFSEDEIRRKNYREVPLLQSLLPLAVHAKTAAELIERQDPRAFVRDACRFVRDVATGIGFEDAG